MVILNFEFDSVHSIRFFRPQIAGGAKVYDVTKYLNDHPGGPEIILEFKGARSQLFFVTVKFLATSLEYCINNRQGR